MALKITLKNSSTPNKRPSPALIGFGEITVNYDEATGGIFYKNNAGGITKVGPCQVSPNPPNSAPAGFPGNGVGEMWLDSTNRDLYVWDGSAWQQATAETIPLVGVSPVNVDTSNPAQTVISVDDASVSAPGVVQLTNSLTSTAETLALTAAAGKNLQDQVSTAALAANDAVSVANSAQADASAALAAATGALPETGGTMTGYITFADGQPVDAGSF